MRVRKWTLAFSAAVVYPAEQGILSGRVWPAVPMWEGEEQSMPRSKADKEKIQSVSQTLIQMTGEFCDQYLDEEYKHLAEKLILKMERKHQVPFLRGRPNTWAAAVIYALGQINFLFDSSFEPYVSADDIAGHFGLSKSTIGQKAKVIRDTFNLFSWDQEFSTQAMREDDPLKDMVMIDGFIVPVSMLSPEEQAELRRRGIIG